MSEHHTRLVSKMGKRKKATELASEYCLSTSAHGVRNIMSSAHVAKKVGWIFILCGVLVGSTYHILMLILSYIEYNYYTSVTVDAGKTLKVRLFNGCQTVQDLPRGNNGPGNLIEIGSI